MAKKKKPRKAKSVNDRVAEHRQRMAESGYRQIAVQLPRTTIQKLDKLCKSAGQSRAVMLDQLIKDNAKPAALSPAKKPTKPKVKGGNCHLCGKWRPDSELDELLRGANRYSQAQCKDFTDCAKRRRIIK